MGRYWSWPASKYYPVIRITNLGIGGSGTGNGISTKFNHPLTYSIRAAFNYDVLSAEYIWHRMRYEDDYSRNMKWIREAADPACISRLYLGIRLEELRKNMNDFY
jgi:hypothetical protein